MQPFPTLTPQARQVLEIIVSKAEINGSTLMKDMGVSHPADLIAPLRELQTLELIEVGGTLADDGLPFARFGIRPSAKEYLYGLLKQSAV